MTEQDAIHAPELMSLTGKVVAAYVGHNSLPAADLPALIGQVHSALQKTQVQAEPEPEPLKPAVSIRKSVTPDYVICLEDGKRFKSLKRHLRTEHGMTPDEYRAKWDLRRDYPLVASNYAATRSALAKKIGLGQLRRKGEGAAQRKSASPAAKPNRRSRPRRTRKS